MKRLIKEVMKKTGLIMMFGWFLLLSGQGFSHQTSESYLTLKRDGSDISGTWSVRLSDLLPVVKIDADLNRQITRHEVQKAEFLVYEYLYKHLKVTQAESSCRIQPYDLKTDRRPSGNYIQVAYEGNCSGSGALTLHYGLLFDQDAHHRARISYQQGLTEITRILTNDQRTVAFNSEASTLNTAVDFLVEGIWHIWMGPDHLLFLLALILPAVLGVRSISLQKYSNVPSIKSLLINVSAIVTCFTLSHSVTLVMASMGWITLPTVLVETLIAVSVVIAGLNILYPVFEHQRCLFAFGFGLIHGFGFASVLQELPLTTGNFLIGLSCFNLGVEVGQLVIVGLVVPVMYSLRNRWTGIRIVTPAVALGIVGIGFIWIVERSWTVLVA